MTRSLSRRGFLGVFSAGAIAGCGGGTGAASIAASEPPAGAGAASTRRPTFPVAYQLFGPVHLQAAMSYVLPSVWQFPGSALTANTALFSWDLDHCRIARALFRMVWTTESTAQVARLVHADDGPVNITEIARIEGRGLGMNRADNQVVNVTAALNALRDGGIYKNLGLQLYGDGVSSFALWESCLEIVWEVP